MAGHSYHSYYEIGREELGRDAKIPIVVCKEPGEAFYELALEMVEEIEKNNAAGRRTVCAPGEREKGFVKGLLVL